MILRSLIMALGFACSLSSCATTSDTPTKPKPHNPGDELSGRPWGQGSRASHYATPFGLPLSQ